MFVENILKRINFQVIMILRSAIVTIIAVCIYCAAFAQDMSPSTKVSQRASITQRVGTTDITIVYHSPLVKGRKIFGGVVPFDFVVDGKEYPWRAGSNQNTTIEFTHDVHIEGQKLSAGIYGLHILVSEKEWTFIFSNNATSWGSFQYDKSEDALRVTVKTEKIPYQEWLSYNFMDREAESTQVELRWEETGATFKIEVDVTTNIINDILAKEEKTSRDYQILAWQSWQKEPENIAGALAWIEKSIELEENFQNKILKADLLVESGDKEKGKALKKEALAMATDFNMYYYGLSLYLLKGNKKASYKALNDYIKNKPKDWIAHLAMGEYYLKENKPQKVVARFEKAYEYAPDNWKNYARYLYLSNKILLE